MFGHHQVGVGSAGAEGTDAGQSCLRIPWGRFLDQPERGSFEIDVGIRSAEEQGRDQGPVLHHQEDLR